MGGGGQGARGAVRNGEEQAYTQRSGPPSKTTLDHSGSLYEPTVKNGV